MKHADAADAACKVSYLFVFLRARKQIQREFNRTINIVILFYYSVNSSIKCVFPSVIFSVIRGEWSARLFDSQQKICPCPKIHPSENFGQNRLKIT